MSLASFQSPTPQIGPNFGFAPPKGPLILAQNETQSGVQAVRAEMERRNNLGYGLGVGIGRYFESRWGPLPPDQGWADVWVGKLINWWQGNPQALARNESPITPQTSSQDLITRLVLEELVEQESWGKLTVKINLDEIKITPLEFIPEFIHLIEVNQPIIEYYGLDPALYQEKLYYNVKGLSDTRISLLKPNYYSESLATVNEILSDNESMILNSIPKDILTDPTKLKEHVARLKPNQDRNRYVLKKLKLQTKIWEKLNAIPGYEGFPFDKIDSLVTRGNPENLGPYSFESEPGFMVSALEGLLDTLEHDTPVNNLQSYIELHDILVENVSSRFASLSGDFTGPFYNSLTSNTEAQNKFMHLEVSSLKESLFRQGLRGEVELGFGLSKRMYDRQGMNDLQQRGDGTWFRLESKEGRAYLTIPPKTPKALKEKGNALFEQYNNLLANAKTPLERLISYAWITRELKLHHIFEDGNGRTTATLFMDLVNKDPDLPKLAGFDPDIFDAYGPGQLTRLFLKKMSEFAAHQEEPHQTRSKTRIAALRTEWEKHFASTDNLAWSSYHAIADPNSELHKAWNVELPSLCNYLLELKKNSLLPADTQFSILKNAVRDVHQIAELAAASGAELANTLVTFPPERLALFETAAIIETEVQIGEEYDLAPIVKEIYEKEVRPALREVYPDLQKRVEQEAKEWAKASIERVKANVTIMGEDDETQKLYETVSTRLESGAYTPGEYHATTDADSAILMLVQDRKYNEIMRKEVERIVTPIVNRGIDNPSRKFPKHNSRGEVIGSEPLQRLSLHSGGDRHTFMFAGAPACGKGTAVGMMMVKAQELGINWSDTVKINTDWHRNIVSSPEELGSNIEWHAALNNDEAKYISDRAAQRIAMKLKKGQAPHMFVDKVSPSLSHMQKAVENGGHMYLSVVTVPTEVSIERAYKRGKQMSRFVPSSYIVSSHQEVSEALHKNLAMIKGANVEYVIYDTNVAFGALPNKIESGNLKTGMVVIHDIKQAETFSGKRNLNSHARNKKDLFPHGTTSTDRTFITNLRKEGSKVKIESTEVMEVRPPPLQFVQTPASPSKENTPKVEGRSSNHKPKL